MTHRVLAAWTSKDALDYPDYVTAFQVGDKITLRMRGSDGSREVTQVTMDKDEFMRFAAHALCGALT